MSACRSSWHQLRSVGQHLQGDFTGIAQGRRKHMSRLEVAHAPEAIRNGAHQLRLKMGIADLVNLQRLPAIQINHARGHPPTLEDPDSKAAKAADEP